MCELQEETGRVDKQKTGCGERGPRRVGDDRQGKENIKTDNQHKEEMYK